MIDFLGSHILTELTDPKAICVIFTETLEKSEAWKLRLLQVVPNTSNIFKDRIFPFGIDEEKGSFISYHGKHIFLIDFYVASKSQPFQAIKNCCTDSRSSIHIINGN
jgi:hypothetical protein